MCLPRDALKRGFYEQNPIPLQQRAGITATARAGCSDSDCSHHQHTLCSVNVPMGKDYGCSVLCLIKKIFYMAHNSCFIFNNISQCL